jgi:hypothetical protein
MGNRQTANELPSDEERHDDHGKRDKGRGRIDPAKVQAVEGHEGIDDDGQRSGLRSGEDVGEEKAVPGEDQGQDSRGHQSRRDERDDDPEQDPPSGAAINPGRLVQLHGNA